jgi:hypothetical protein
MLEGVLAGALAANAPNAKTLAARAPKSPDCSDRRKSVRGELSTADQKAEISRSE